MTGLAKQLYYERCPTTAPHTDKLSLIADLIERKALHYVDYIFAQQILAGSWTEKSALFLSYLLRSSRDGHLCVEISQKLLPDPKELFNELYSECGEQYNWLVLRNKITEGSKEVAVLIEKAKENIPLNYWNHRFYLQCNWTAETIVIDQLKKISGLKPFLSIDNEKLESILEQLSSSGRLLEEQASAIRCAAINLLTIVTGGPGTGKTYTASHLVSVLWQCLNDSQKDQLRICVSAPTGKATTHLFTQVSRFLSSHGELASKISFKTLQALVKMRKNSEENDDEPIDADILLVDESSMIDVNLFAKLLTKLKEGSRLILLGDCAQLPPIEAGNLFADLTTIDSLPKIFLTRCLRIELQTMLSFAKSICDGQCQAALHLLNENQAGLKRFNPENILDEKLLQNAILKAVIPLFPSDHQGEWKQLFKEFSKFRILSPLRNGLLGSDQLNAMLAQYFLLKSQKNNQLFVAPILVKSNHYPLDLFNGDLGLLVTDSSNDEMPYALFPAREEELPLRRFYACQIPNYEYAYCISVHKSQGSEFDEVFIVLPEAASRFGREVLYTAVTRAKKSLCICGSDAVLHGLINKQCKRLSSINQRILQNQ
ncbi:MAG: exodeoxyribonuclease V subunit alpha [Parachlamydiales bacterium]|nr:exodeoxyribonuclease V subunit alpha [Parachlamydiales bacterium]